MADGLASLLFQSVTSVGSGIGKFGSVSGQVATLQTIRPPDKTFFMNVLIGLILLVAFISVCYGIYYAATQKKSSSDPINVELKKQQQKLLLEDVELPGTISIADTMRKVDKKQQFLVNFQPLTARVGGFMGPMQEGVFDAGTYCRWCIKSGIRSFVLPISQHKDDNKDEISKTSKQWPAAFEPAIFFRNVDGQITSINAITIEEFLTALLSALNENSAQQKDPLLLLFVESPGQVPDKVKEEAQYAQFLSKIANQISKVGGMNNMILTSLGTYGDPAQGLNEDKILMNTPLDQLGGKLLIATDFDIDIAKKNEYVNLYPNTLGKYTNLRIRPRTGKDNKGNTRAMRVEDISGSKEDWPNEARTFFLTSALEHMYEDLVYGTEELRGALDKGIQCIPLPFGYGSDLKAAHALWNGTAWRVKPEAYRFTQPTPVEAAKPSEKMNARVAANLQPGQTKIN